jgi:glutamate 5-kinase
MCALCETVARLHKSGVRVVLVSSGAVGRGFRSSTSQPILSRFFFENH